MRTRLQNQRRQKESHIMKAQLSLRVRQALRAEMEEFVAGEKRKLGNVGEVLLEWGFEQLKAAGSLDGLRKCKIGSASGTGKERKEPV